MILTDTQTTVWIAMCVVPALVMSRAWFALLSAILGGDSARDDYLRGLVTGTSTGRQQDVGLVSILLRAQPPGVRRVLQRRFRVSFLLAATVATVGWFVAGWAADRFTIPDIGLRALQIGGSGILLAADLKRLVQGTARWAPRPLRVLGIVIWSLAIIVALVPS